MRRIPVLVCVPLFAVSAVWRGRVGVGVGEEGERVCVGVVVVVGIGGARFEVSLISVVAGSKQRQAVTAHTRGGRESLLHAAPSLVATRCPSCEQLTACISPNFH